MVRNQVRDTPIYEQMRSFLKLFLDLILSHQINSDILPNSSATLYVLICLYRETYEQLVQILVQSQVGGHGVDLVGVNLSEFTTLSKKHI